MNVVLLGAFVPDRYRPSALADANIIPRDEAKEAIPRSVVPGLVTQFDFLWGEMLVATDRFHVKTNEAPYVRICDLVVKALKDIQADYRVTAFGVNVESHYDFGSPEARDKLGRRLAPPDAWGKWGEEISQSMNDPGLLHGGMVLVQMRKPFRDDEVYGWMDIFVGPLNVPSHGGVYFRSNHHHQARSDVRATDQPVQLLNALVERFDASVEAAENIFDGVLADYNA